MKSRARLSTDTPVTESDAQRARRLGLADLARSGLDEKDAALLQLEFLPPAKTEALVPGFPQCATRLPYFEPSGKRRPEVCRVRLLEPPPAGAFGARATEWLRYTQPKGSPVAAYFPPNVKKPWPVQLADKATPVWVTEGEKKAAAACKHGFLCVGLGGVWSFGSKAAGTELLPELAAIDWQGRPAYICFDSDVMQKVDVAKAVTRLTEVLRLRGAVIQSVLLPELVPGQKCGLDDFLVARGQAGLNQLMTRQESVEGDLAIELWRMSERFAVLEHPASVFDDRATDEQGRPQPKPLAAAAFARVVAGHVRAMKVKETRTEWVSVADEWLKWPCRRGYEALTYAPGQPRQLPHRRLNSWLGLACEPKKGNLRPWHELLDHLFTGADEAAREWFERWCGYPLHRLGTKLLSAVGMWSAKTGQGKTLVGETLGHIYGANFISIPQIELESNFTSWALGRQFVLVDDISSHDTRQRADLLKKLITQREFNVNLKHVPQFTMPDFINYYFTSNHGDAFYLDEHDRRLFIHEVVVGKLPVKFYDAYYEWLNGEGPSALLHYFQRELDYSDFCPTAAPPVTDAKREMIEGVRSELDAWLASLSDLDLAGRELWTAAELADKFNAAALGRRVPPNAFGRRLRRFCPCVGLVEEGEGRRARYYAVKSGEKWMKAPGKEKASHVKATKRF